MYTSSKKIACQALILHKIPKYDTIIVIKFIPYFKALWLSKKCYINRAMENLLLRKK